MGRSISTAQVPVLGSIFGNGSISYGRFTQGDGAIYMAKISSSGSPQGVINSLEFPKAAVGLASYYKSFGTFNYNIPSGNLNFGILQTQGDVSRAFTYGMHLAKSATIYQSNKTENYYANGVDYPNVSMIGVWRIGYYSSGSESQLAVIKYSGNQVTGTVNLPIRQVYAHYYDTVNSANVWLCLNEASTGCLRVSTTDGVNFTTANITLANSRYVYNCGSLKPVVFMNGNNGLLILRKATNTVLDNDEVLFFQTANNFTSASNISANWYTAGTGAGFPILFNYDGTTVFAALGNGSSTTVVPKYSTNLGTSVSTSTVSGATSTFYGCYGGSSSFNGFAGAGLAHCTGANASQFMYISYDQGNSTAFSYYTANGGQSFTAVSLQSQLDTVAIGNNSYDGFLCVNYHAGRWVALFQKTNLGIYAITSTNNGNSWTNPVKVFNYDNSYPSNLSNALCQVFSHNGTFIAVKSGGYSYQSHYFAKSTNGTTWTEIDDPYRGYGEGGGFIELDNSFIVLGRVLDKTTFTITNYTREIMPTQSYLMHYLAVSGSKLIAGQYNAGAAVVNDNVISSNIFATSVPTYTATYSTSGSAYGSFEYVRVK